MFENRDYPGSTHFFFDIGNGNTLAFFDFPGSTSARTPRCSAGPPPGHHDRSRQPWPELPRRLDDAGIEYHDESGSSLYFRGPDGERIELITDPLGEMYGTPVL